MEVLKVLYDYFPTAVNTGKSLVFISEDWRIELTEHSSSNFGQAGGSAAIIRVRISKRAINGEFMQGYYEDFQHANMGELATQIERYIQFAVGANIRENA